MSGQSSGLHRTRTMDPRYFGAVNAGPQIPSMADDCPGLRHLHAIG
jgi:hypothetical protein